jgi:hypothetical protein
MTELLLWFFGFFAVISVPLLLVISWWDKGEVRREARVRLQLQARETQIKAEMKRIKDKQSKK